MSGVPVEVLLAISRTETGRSRGGKLQPWPWTVNMEGAGAWFDDRTRAEAHVAGHYSRGARSFDVGCFQINYKWHGEAFDSVEQMFDPEANAIYAAQFLRSLFDEFGDWSKAAGAYHSRTPSFANRYRKRFDRILGNLGGDLQKPPAPAKAIITGPKPLIGAEIRPPFIAVADTPPANTGLGSLFPGAGG